MKRLFFFVAFFSIACLVAQPAQSLPETVIISSFAGDAKVTPAGKTRSVPCEAEMLLKAGDRIKTGRESYVEMAFERRRKNIVRIEESSDVVIKLVDGEKVELIDGTIFTVLLNLKRGEMFRVKTPCGVCGARGTGWKTTTDGNVVDVAVFDGRLFSRGIMPDGSVMEREYWIDEGFERTIKKFEKPGKMVKIPEEKVAAWRKRFNIPNVLQSRRWQTKLRSIDSGIAGKEKRMESITDRKDEARRDKMREDNDKDRASRDGGGERSREITP